MTRREESFLFDQLADNHEISTNPAIALHLLEAAIRIRASGIRTMIEPLAVAFTR
jgi:hypothetical protein